MLTPNPNECNSTLTSVTGGTYPHPDTYIYKCSLVVWNLGSPCNLRAETLEYIVCAYFRAYSACEPLSETCG